MISPTARVQQGPSEAARCAIKEAGSVASPSPAERIPLLAPYPPVNGGHHGAKEQADPVNDTRDII